MCAGWGMSSCTCVVAPSLGEVSRPPDEVHVRGSLRRCCSARAADCVTFGEDAVRIWEPPEAAGAAEAEIGSQSVLQLGGLPGATDVGVARWCFASLGLEPSRTDEKAWFSQCLRRDPRSPCGGRMLARATLNASRSSWSDTPLSASAADFRLGLVPGPGPGGS